MVVARMSLYLQSDWMHVSNSYCSISCLVGYYQVYIGFTHFYGHFWTRYIEVSFVLWAGRVITCMSKSEIHSIRLTLLEHLATLIHLYVFFVKSNILKMLYFSIWPFKRLTLATLEISYVSFAFKCVFLQRKCS